MNKLLAIISALTICFSLTACGDTGSEKSADTTAETTTTTAKPTETTTTAPPETTTTTEATTTTVAETEPPVEEKRKAILKSQVGYYDYENKSIFFLADYDEEGNCLIKYQRPELYTTPDDGTIIYEYDDKNRIIKESHYTEKMPDMITDDDIPTYFITYEYEGDLISKSIEEEAYYEGMNYPDGHIERTLIWKSLRTIEYEYDEHNNVTKETETLESYTGESEEPDVEPSKNTRSYSYKYDDSGKIIEEKRSYYSSDEKIVYEYDINEKLIAKKNYFGSKVGRLEEYDSSGNLVAEYSGGASSDHYAEIFLYEYDENNNRISQIKYYNAEDYYHGDIPDSFKIEKDIDGYKYFAMYEVIYENTYY